MFSFTNRKNNVKRKQSSSVSYIRGKKTIREEEKKARLGYGDSLKMSMLEERGQRRVHRAGKSGDGIPISATAQFIQ